MLFLTLAMPMHVQAAGEEDENALSYITFSARYHTMAAKYGLLTDLDPMVVQLPELSQTFASLSGAVLVFIDTQDYSVQRITMPTGNELDKSDDKARAVCVITALTEPLHLFEIKSVLKSPLLESLELLDKVIAEKNVETPLWSFSIFGTDDAYIQIERKK